MVSKISLNLFYYVVYLAVVCLNVPSQQNKLPTLHISVEKEIQVMFLWWNLSSIEYLIFLSKDVQVIVIITRLFLWIVYFIFYLYQGTSFFQIFHHLFSWPPIPLYNNCKCLPRCNFKRTSIASTMEYKSPFILRISNIFTTNNISVWLWAWQSQSVTCLTISYILHCLNI